MNTNTPNKSNSVPASAEILKSASASEVLGNAGVGAPLYMSVPTFKAWRVGQQDDAGMHSGVQVQARMPDAIEKGHWSNARQDWFAELVFNGHRVHSAFMFKTAARELADLIASRVPTPPSESSAVAESIASKLETAIEGVLRYSSTDLREREIRADQVRKCVEFIRRLPAPERHETAGESSAVVSVSLEDCQRAYVREYNAVRDPGSPSVAVPCNAEIAGIAAVRALFVKDAENLRAENARLAEDNRARIGFQRANEAAASAASRLFDEKVAALQAENERLRSCLASKPVGGERDAVANLITHARRLSGAAGDVLAHGVGFDQQAERMRRLNDVREAFCKAEWCFDDIEKRKLSTPAPADPRGEARPLTADEKRRTGLIEKFRVTRTDGTDAPGCKHDGCHYYVLDITHDKHAPAALRAYADSCRSEYPVLAADLDKLAPSLAPSGTGTTELQSAWCLLAEIEFDVEHGHNGPDDVREWMAKWRAISNGSAPVTPPATEGCKHDGCHFMRIEDVGTWRCAKCDAPHTPKWAEGVQPAPDSGEVERVARELHAIYIRNVNSSRQWKDETPEWSAIFIEQARYALTLRPRAPERDAELRLRAALDEIRQFGNTVAVRIATDALKAPSTPPSNLDAALERTAGIQQCIESVEAQRRIFHEVSRVQENAATIILQQLRALKSRSEAKGTA